MCVCVRAFQKFSKCAFCHHILLPATDGADSEYEEIETTSVEGMFLKCTRRTLGWMQLIREPIEKFDQTFCF